MTKIGSWTGIAKKVARVGSASLLLLAAVAGRARATEAAGGRTPIKLVAAPYLSSAPFFIALDLGLFAAEGLDVELVELAGGPSSLPALAQDQVDVVGAMVVPALFNLVQRGAAIRIVAGRAYEARDGCVAGAMMARQGLVAAGRLQAGPAALRGLRLSTDRTGAPFFFVDTLLDSAGLSLDDVELSDIAPPARGEALARDLIDVTMAFEPAVTQLLDAGSAEIWIPARDIVPDFQYTFLLFGRRLLSGDRGAGRRFLRAYLAAVERYLDEGKSPRIVEILARHTKLDPDLLRRACWPATARDGAIDAASLERYQAWALQAGLVDQRLELARLVDAELLESAARGAAAEPPPDRAWYESLTVTAARSELDRTEVPANVTVLGGDQIRESAALTLDSVLRQVPGFATLRQQSSMVSTVQSQSVSLRGLGGTTTSRTLVLLDGIPMNDAYGGWVYWVKAPRELLDKVEVVRGGGSAIWGNLALGGVINLMTIEPTGRTVSAAAIQGEYRTSDLTLALADAGSAWSGWVSGNYFDTDGYETLREDLRGAIDQPTAKRHATFLGKVSHAPSARVSLHASADSWSEDRERGTPLDRGSADAWSAVANASAATSGGGWELRLFSRHQDWESLVTRVSLDRTAETPSSRIVHQPSDVLGASLQRSRAIGGKHSVLAGADLQLISIEHHQDLTFRSGGFVERADVEGRQDLAGVFVQDVFRPSPRWSVQAGSRLDHIENHDGEVVTSDLTTGAVTGAKALAESSETTINPSLGAVFQANDRLALRASSYTGFRAPTPAELYKGFRTGSAVVEANSELEPERLLGAELGADYRRSTRFFGRATGFWNELEDLILQTTVGVAGPAGANIPPCGAIAPRGACRQRSNVGRVRAVGLELEGEYRPSPRWSVSLSGLLEEIEVTSAPQLPDLEGKRLPQAPEEQAVLRVRWSDPDLLDVLVQGRYVGPRFEDDVNTLSIESLVVADLTLSHQLTPSTSVFVGVENLFDREYEVSLDTTGVVLVERRLAHLGIRFHYR